MAGQNPMDGRAPLRREDGDGIATLLLDRPEAYNALSVGLDRGRRFDPRRRHRRRRAGLLRGP
jgi:hypothetical protein